MEKNPIASGFYFDKPREGAPEFVKARIGVKVDDAIALLQKYRNEAGYVNLELLKKKDGTGHYLQVNTYGLDVAEPIDRPAQPDESWRKEQEEGTGVPEITSDEVPF